jgi:hypothetical protein
MNDEKLKELLLINGFDIQEQEDMRHAITQKILYLLEHDLNRLYALLYRIDVSEQKAKDAFGGSTQEIASKLCELIINRLQEKIESRRKN